MIRRRFITSSLLALIIILVYLSVYTNGGADESREVVYNLPSVEELGHDLGLCSTRGLSLNAKSVLVVDNSNDAWIYAKRPQRVRPVASLTKLLTAMVFLESGTSLDTVVYISNRDCYNSAKSHVYKGEAYKAIDLFYAAIMSSDNRAARALATASGYPRQVFIDKMNEKAKSIGMRNTAMYEVTGLNERNVSTAADLAILINKALEYPLIKKASSTYIYNCKLQNKNRKKRFINTNRLVRSRWKVLAGKTGYIVESDYCLATVIRDKNGRELTLVVLGSPWNSTRFAVARKLAFWGFKRAGRTHDGTQQIASR